MCCRPFRLAVLHWLGPGAVSTPCSTHWTSGFAASGTRTRLRLHHATSCSSRECRHQRITIFVYTVNCCADVGYQVLENQTPCFHCQPECGHGAPHSEDTAPAHNHVV